MITEVTIEQCQGGYSIICYGPDKNPMKAIATSLQEALTLAAQFLNPTVKRVEIET